MVVQSVDYAEPLCDSAVVAGEAPFQEFGNFDKRDSLFVVEFFVFLILETNAVPVIRRLGETIEHLETDEVQILQSVAFSFDTACNGVLCRIKNQACVVRIVFDMLYFEHNPVETLVGCHDVRGDAFTECVGQSGVDVGEVVDAIASDESKNCIQPFGRLRDLLKVA